MNGCWIKKKFQLTSKPLLQHTSKKHPTIALRYSSDSPHRTKSSAYKRPGNLQFLSFSRNLSPLLSIPIITSFIMASICTEKPREHYTTLSLATVIPSPFILTQARLLIHILLIPLNIIPTTGQKIQFDNLKLNLGKC